ncbi:MAG: site-2 protease family protein [bacterium]|nr:site-2 protease family protein [bacterium]
MFLVIFIFLLVLLILVHEFGHFIVAKAFGIRVDEFGIFFPPKLWSVKYGETEYSLNALPFGGFVRIFGESHSANASRDEQTNSRSFINKPRFVQAAVIIAGVFFNFLFAWLALSAGYMVGIPTSVEHIGVGEVHGAHTTITAVLPGSPAEQAGIRAGDQVEAAHTGTAELALGASADALQQFILVHQDESVVLSVLRPSSLGASNKEARNFLAKPVEGLAQGHKAIGIELDDIGVLQLPPHLALVQGAILGKEMTVAIMGGLVGLVSQIFSGTANLAGIAGPIGIVGLGGEAVRQGFVATILLTSLISINLAIINVLPIPGLDGGRLLFIAIESIIRRPISERLATRLTIASFALLATLMLVVSWHDIIRLVKPV